MKANLCPNCGSKQNEESLFCSNCGNKIENISNINTKQPPKKVVAKPLSSESVFTKINKEITIQNNQSSIAKKSWYAAGFFLLIIFIAFMDFDFLPIHPALAFISFFFLLCAIVIALMFRSRAKKMQKLITGENLLAEWTLSNEQKEAYINYLFENEKGKNQVILYSISAISFIVFGIFILMIDEGKLAMTGVWIGLIIFLSLFAFGMPFYYRRQNRKSDGRILIGAKYIYLNGFFHNWDFILSGLSKVKVIKKPFYGINLVYYYTDRTFKHSEELFIPVNNDIDLEDLIKNLKEHNK